METLAIDIETYSDVDLKKVGVYKYVDSDNFKILLLAYAFDDEEVEIVDLENGEELPQRVALALTNKDTVKTAFNAQFERVCIDKHFNLKTENWECTMVKSLSLGMPGSLESVGRVIGIEPDQQKLSTGKHLIRLFCVPCKDTNTEGLLFKLKTKKTGYTKEDRPEEWEQFKEYCIRDVEVERLVRKKLDRFKTLNFEKELYALDQEINDRGVLIDLEMAKNAIAIDAEQTERLTTLFCETTGLQNPNSLTELKKYIKSRTGKTLKSITKHNLSDLKETFTDYPDIITALEIRQQLSKTSIAKYQKMIDVACKDSRARGLLYFYGARTGRWAGRLIQVQNLPSNKMKGLDTARLAVKTSDLDTMEMLYDSPADVLSQCIRPAIIPSPGKKFIVSDFSAIEARVIAWLAGEEWRMEVFRSHGKIYEASASQMFNVPLEQIDRGSPLRNKGKIAELALGYQGGAGALAQMGALDMGLAEEELPELVKQWRGANRQIVKFWYDTDIKVKEVIQNRSALKIKNNLKAFYRSGILFLELPSGRRLAYVKPKVVDHHEWEGRQKITFHEMNPRTYQWQDRDTYGGRLVENIVQATARDCLAYSMLALEKEGYKIVMHVHDEVVIEIDEDKDELQKVIEIMSRELPWAKGLPLRADGYECSYYMKD